MKQNWNLDVIANPDNFERIRKEVEESANNFVEKWNNNLEWLEKADVLKEALVEYSNWIDNYGEYDKEMYYYSMMLTLDEANAEIKAKYNSIHKLAVEIANKINFFEIRLSKVNSQIQTIFLESDSLKEYKHFLERLFRSGAHILSESEEKILTLKSKVSHNNWVDMLSSLLSEEEREVLNEEGNPDIKNFSEILELISNRDKKVRDKAAEVFNQILVDYVKVSENEINSVLENKQITDQIRGYNRPDESRFIADDITAESVETLVATVTKSFEISKRFYELKAKVLGLDKLEYHERNIEINNIYKKYPFDEAYTLVKNAFGNLDSELENIFVRLFQNGQVDVNPKKGKAGGAFCITVNRKLPTLVMLNHTNSLTDVTTMAHEFGHGINFELSQIQNGLNYDFPMCTAETASTFCEDYVIKELLKDADDETKFNMYMMKLNSDVSTIFRQIAFYNFETELHAEHKKLGYLSKEQIGKIFQKHMQSYMGDSVIQSEGSENWWIYVTHFRRFFYVYSYAFGLLVSKVLQSRVESNPKYINEVKQFFGAGNSNSPEELLKDINIDISSSNVWEEGLKLIENTLGETISLGEKLGKI
ncbi:M3 family oligoendopeptidase [Candidatus Dojkabacteria bacterium]|uniref:M3 family oligoendopeptidase n=1 Tax=Candidatus Dojkabacteria bacterium TaxID=2099670 RepID=A0A955L174_9BACT|nr:M3 family oligoendopeptidase [Candidatus Dojkabacteria bacterium]